LVPFLLEGGNMGFGDSIISALFVMLIVFGVLLLLWGLIVLFSKVIAIFEKQKAKSAVATTNEVAASNERG
jgi:Na+-transporting methylmalonyl-CoA/oxaloacetate decarboxylase gamma subunit